MPHNIFQSSNSKDDIFCDNALNTLGYVGSTVSLVFLIISTLSLCASRYEFLVEMLVSLRILFCSRWMKVSTNSAFYLAICFNTVYALFLFCFTLFSDQTTAELDDSGCEITAAVTYSLLLATVVMTCCRAAHIYRKFVDVYQTGPSPYFLNLGTILATAGLPIFITKLN